MVIYEGIHFKFLFAALLCAMLFTQKEFRFAAFFFLPDRIQGTKHPFYRMLISISRKRRNFVKRIDDEFRVFFH